MLSLFAVLLFSGPVYILDTPTRDDLLTTIGDLRKWQQTLQENLESAEKNSELLLSDLDRLRNDLKQVTENLQKLQSDLELSRSSLASTEEELKKAQDSLTQLSKDLTDLRQRSFLSNLLIGSVGVLTGFLVGLTF